MFKRLAQGTFQSSALVAAQPIGLERKSSVTSYPTGASEMSDDSLALQGDVESFVQLYHRYVRPLFSYLYSRLGDRQDAEDVTSVAFERAWLSIGRYVPVPSGSFRGWLFTVARRALADHLRSRKPPSVDLAKIADALADTFPGPEERALAGEQWRQVVAAVSSLPHEQQEIIALRFFGGLTYRDIAEVLGKNEAAVKMAAYRALAQVRRTVGEE
jgi:RNA polymerase sigma-70 factor, ECF subfamily